MNRPMNEQSRPPQRGPQTPSAVTHSRHRGPVRDTASFPTGPRRSPGESDNKYLIDGLIGLYDLTTDGAVRAHIAQLLQGVGVERDVIPVGATFDPAVHDPVSTEQTGIRLRDRRVAKTIRPGWRWGMRIIRAPLVTVWVAAAA